MPDNNKRKRTSIAIIGAVLVVALVVVVGLPGGLKGLLGHAFGPRYGSGSGGGGGRFGGADGGGGGSGATVNNVLLVIADDIGVDKVGAWSADADASYRSEAAHLPSTPTLDSLAQNGARFADAWSNPTCSPTRAAIMTGTHALRHGVGEPIGKPGGHQLDLSTTTTLAQVMGAQGYATGLFGKWHLGTNGAPDGWADGDEWEDHLGESTAFCVHPISAGFDSFSGTLTGSLDECMSGGSYNDWVALDARKGTEGQADTVVAEERTEYATDSTVRDALAWIDEQSGPWFAVVSLNAAHTPLELPPEGCSYRSPDAAAPTSSRGIYEEMVECLDRGVGDLLDGIADLDDTTVIFVGDNGTARGVAEGVFDDDRGKGTIYESGVRVPLVVADGKVLAQQRDTWSWSQDWTSSPVHVADPGSAIEDPVHLVDLFATVAGFGGGDASSGVDSISLQPLLDGSDGAVRSVNYTEGFDPAGVGQAALRYTNYKLIVDIQPGTDGTPCRSSVELYDLDADRFEETDIAAEEPTILDDLSSRLDTIAADVDGAWIQAAPCSS